MSLRRLSHLGLGKQQQPGSARSDRSLALQSLFGGFLIHAALGSLYIWGNLTTYITSYLREFSPGLTYGDTLAVFAASLAGQACVLPIGGKVQERVGPFCTTCLGAVLLVAGTLSACVVETLWAMVVFYGVMAGMGVGFAYTPPLVLGYAWIPERKGLITGITVAGFGAGTFAFDYLATAYVNPHDLSPTILGKDDELYYNSAVADRVPGLFLVLGSCYALLLATGLSLLRDPPPHVTTAWRLTSGLAVPAGLSPVSGYLGTRKSRSKAKARRSWMASMTSLSYGRVAEEEEEEEEDEETGDEADDNGNDGVDDDDVKFPEEAKEAERGAEQLFVNINLQKAATTKDDEKNRTDKNRDDNRLTDIKSSMSCDGGDNDEGDSGCGPNDGSGENPSTSKYDAVNTSASAAAGTESGSSKTTTTTTNKSQHQPHIHAFNYQQSQIGYHYHQHLQHQYHQKQRRPPVTSFRRSSSTTAAGQLHTGGLVRSPIAWHLAITYCLTGVAGLFILGTYKSTAASSVDGGGGGGGGDVHYGGSGGSGGESSAALSAGMFSTSMSSGGDGHGGGGGGGGNNSVDDDKFLALVGSMAALTGAAGRLGWGYLSDVIGWGWCLLLMSSIEFTLLWFYSFTIESRSSFMAFTCLIALTHGGNYAIYPTATVSLFGQLHAGTNYGLIFTAFGVASFFSLLFLSTLEVNWRVFSCGLALMQLTGFISVGLLIYKLEKLVPGGSYGVLGPPPPPPISFPVQFNGIGNSSSSAAAAGYGWMSEEYEENYRQWKQQQQYLQTDQSNFVNAVASVASTDASAAGLIR